MPTDTFNPEIDGWVRGTGGSQAAAVAANGSFNRVNFGNVAYVGLGGTTYFTARTYYRFDTTSDIPTNADVSSAKITVELQNSRGSTADAIEVVKLWSSTDNSSLFGSSLYQTTGSAGANTSTDVGNTGGSSHDFIIDGDLLTFLKDHISAGTKPAFLLRCKGDYDVATEGNASGVNTRGFYGHPASAGGVPPVLSVTYTLPLATYGNNVAGVDSGDITKVNGVLATTIEKVIGVD